jgi:hypothetical protein
VLVAFDVEVLVELDGGAVGVDVVGAREVDDGIGEVVVGSTEPFDEQALKTTNVAMATPASSDGPALRPELVIAIDLTALPPSS